MLSARNRAQYAEQLFRLTVATSEIIECVKHFKHLSKNTAKYVVLDKDYIGGEYNELRLRIARILREIYLHRETEEASKEIDLAEEVETVSR